uniref:Uncharacterized protein n=1 Tax=Melanopsichium pennsylvanicum 4 TaxID=1398559 RepID=A0A077R498_9BASI|nr:uncharacterized protein BN887_00759 [Melanopsichium pennsylvanicum 4]
MHFFRLLWTSIVLLIACELASAAGGESSSSGYIKKSFFGRFGKKKEKRPPTLLESIGTFDDIKDALNEEFGIVMEDIQKKFDHGVKNGWITAEGGMYATLFKTAVN